MDRHKVFGLILFLQIALASCTVAGPRPVGDQAGKAEERFSSITFSADADYVAVSSTYRLYVYRTDTLEEMWSVPVKGGAGRTAFSPDGSRLASLSVDDRVVLWDTERGRRLATWRLRSRDEWIRSYELSLAWPADGSLRALWRGLSDAVVWDVETGKELVTLGRGLDVSVFVTGPSRLWRAGWSPDGTGLSYGLYDNRVSVWKVDTGELVQMLEGHTSPAFSLAYSPDGARLASMSAKEVIAWNAETGERLLTLGGETAGGLTWSPDGGELAGGQYDGSIVIWDADTGERLHTFAGPTSAVLVVAYSPDGATLYSGCLDGRVIAWDVETGLQLRALGE